MRNPYAHSGSGAGAPDPSLATTDPRVADYESAIGPNSGYYLARFERFDAGGPQVSWHWPAFFATSGWFIYRKMWLVGVLNFFFPFVLWIGVSIAVALTRSLAMFWLLLLLPLPSILLPMYANQLYWQRTRALIDQMPASIALDPARRAARLEAQGGVGTGPMVGALSVMGLIWFGLIGMVAAISIPAYQDYTIRAQVAEGLALASVFKAGVADHYYRHNEWPRDHQEFGQAPASGKYVKSVTVDRGSIVIVYGGRASRALQRGTLYLVPGVNERGDVVWACGDRMRETADWGPGPSGTDIAQKYLPRACRSVDQ